MANVTAAERVVISSREPDATKINCEIEGYRARLLTAFTWYTTEKTSKDSLQYLTSWAKKANKKWSENILSTPQHIPPTFGWVARLLTNGAKLSQSEMKTFHTFLDTLRPAVVKKVEKSAAPRANIQESIKEKGSNILGEFEWMLDQLKMGIPVAAPNVYLNSKEIGRPYLSIIDGWAKAKMGHFLTVYQSKEADIKEGYSNYKKADLQRIMVFLKTLCDAISTYGQEKKANRKPRAKKVVAPGVQVKTLKYKIEDTEFKLKSINPADIIGAQQLWVFNTKYRKLGVYKTDSALGLQCKGSTIQNYLPEQSMQKTLRKPADVIPNVLEAGKIKLRTVLDNIKGKASVMNGRINDEVILLRVVK